MDRLILIPRSPSTRSPAARPVGRVLAELPLLVRDAVAGSIGPSRGIVGRGPAWLARAADVRVVGMDASNPDRPAILLSAPLLGEAAPEQFKQRTLFPELIPDRDDTGLDVLSDSLRNLADSETGQTQPSVGLMRRMLRLMTALAPTSELQGFSLHSGRRHSFVPALVTIQTLDLVQKWLRRRTETTAVQFIGCIDRLELDAGRFRLKTERNVRIWCEWNDRKFDSLHLLWGARVRIHGIGHFAVSGKLRRVEVERLVPVNSDDARVFDMVLRQQ